MKEAAHLIRLGIVLLAGAGIFAIARQAFVPAGFGQLGHFRAGALQEIPNKPLVYAGRAACAACHDDVLQSLTKSRHARIGCEACHGPQFAHTENPTEQKPALPDTRVLCVRCHEANSGRPKFVPQVVVAEHAGSEPCKSCHQPHSPKLGG